LDKSTDLSRTFASSTSVFFTSCSSMSSLGSRGIRSHASSRESGSKQANSEASLRSPGSNEYSPIVPTSPGNGTTVQRPIKSDAVVSPTLRIISSSQRRRQYTPTIVHGSKRTMSYSERVMKGQIAMPAGTRSTLKPTPEGSILNEF
jgi:hypothetical protein